MEHNNRFIIKYIILTGVFFLLFKGSQAQNSNFSDHIRFGGGIGLGFSNDFFSASLEPSAIYRFNPQFALGAGINFTYNSQKDFYRSTIIGGTATALYNPLPYIQLSGEFQELHVSRNFDNSRVFYQDEDYWYPALLLGIGFQTNHITFGVRYDVLYDNDKSIYGSPWSPFVRVYF